MPHLLMVALLLGAPAPGDDAHALTVQSIREYNTGDFELALRDIKRAYDLSGLPALLFNLGQCHRALGHWREAEFSYRAYLREKPGARNRTEVLGLIDQMEKKEQETVLAPPVTVPLVVPAAPGPAAPHPGPPPSAAAEGVGPASSFPHEAGEGQGGEATTSAAPEATAEGPAPRKRIAPATWWIGGAGLAAVAAGTVLGVVALQGDQTVSGAPGYHQATYPAFQTAQYEGLGADIAWSVGGALVVAAVVVALAAH